MRTGAAATRIPIVELGGRPELMERRNYQGFSDADAVIRLAVYRRVGSLNCR